jgi:hypothetical protein
LIINFQSMTRLPDYPITRCCLALLWLAAASCTRSPVAPEEPSIDVLDYLVGDSSLWPRMGDQHQHQTAEPGRVCWTKYTLGWMFECWTWDDTWVYHEVDHGIDGVRWVHYTFSDGRWLPRRLQPGEVWSLDLPDNRMTWVDAACVAQPEEPAPYRLRAWHERAFDAGGDLGVRDVVILEYQPNPVHAAPDTAERFYLAKGAGWFLWTRGPNRVAFNRVGGKAQTRTPWCARDYVG